MMLESGFAFFSSIIYYYFSDKNLFSRAIIHNTFGPKSH